LCNAFGVGLGLGAITQGAQRRRPWARGVQSLWDNEPYLNLAIAVHAPFLVSRPLKKGSDPLAGFRFHGKKEARQRVRPLFQRVATMIFSIG